MNAIKVNCDGVALLYDEIANLGVFVKFRERCVQKRSLEPQSLAHNLIQVVKVLSHLKGGGFP